ncbi:MAG: hypothetical protein U0636_08715 [Phycisphaerales bacterium]
MLRRFLHRYWAWVAAGTVLILLIGGYYFVDHAVRQSYRNQLSDISTHAQQKWVKAVLTAAPDDDVDACRAISPLATDSVEIEGSSVSALQFAMMAGSAVAVDALLRAGADPQARLPGQLNALEYAVDRGWPQWIPLLLKPATGGPEHFDAARAAQPADWCKALELLKEMNDAQLVARLRERGGEQLRACEPQP